MADDGSLRCRMRVRKCLLNDETNEAYLPRKADREKGLPMRCRRDYRKALGRASACCRNTKSAGDQIAKRREADGHRRIEMDLGMCPIA